LRSNFVPLSKNYSYMQKLIVQIVVGYMYKVIKNGIDTSSYKAEFAAIKHGNYMFE